MKTVKRGFVRVSTEIFAYVGLSRSIEELWIIVGVGVFLYVAHNYVGWDDIASYLVSEFFGWQFFYRLRTTIWRIFYPRVECSVSEQEVLSQNVDSGTCLIVGVRWRLFLFSDCSRTTHCRYTFMVMYKCDFAYFNIFINLVLYTFASLYFV